MFTLLTTLTYCCCQCFLVLMKCNCSHIVCTIPFFLRITVASTTEATKGEACTAVTWVALALAIAYYCSNDCSPLCCSLSDLAT